MDWQMISLLGLVPAFTVGLMIGRASVDYPSDEEMFRRLVANRSRARIEKEVETALQDELHRQTARS